MPEKETETKEKRREDPEMRAIRMIESQLRKIENFDSRLRVLRFVSDRTAERHGEQMRLEFQRKPQPVEYAPVAHSNGSTTDAARRF